MRTVRWQLVPALLVSTGVVVVWGCAFAARDLLGPWQYAIYFGGLLALVGVLWSGRRLSSARWELEAVKAEIAEKRSELQQQRRDLRRAHRQAEAQLRRQSARLDRREQELARQLIRYHEGMALPESVDLADHAVSDEDLSELVQKDRRMLELLEQESKALFEKIRNNAYAADGKFQPALLRDDVYQLIERVARIYQPDAKQPVLETSLAQLLHAASRACLHFLVVLDSLPVNMKQYNLNHLYGYVRQGVKAYGVYKAAAPYFPYVNTAYRLGRLAMGANPASQGAWWFLGALSKKGAAALATRIVNRQALVLLHDLIRVVGFEVAGIYGGDFRHRDANWIYAAELTELIRSFPLSRESLSHGLREIGAVQLRSEYDRVHLYRLLAQHKSARPERFRAAGCLTSQERQAIAARLEKFLAAFVEAQPAARVARWRAGVEARLRVRLDRSDQRPGWPAPQQREDAAGCLAAFLLEVKQREPAELVPLLRSTAVLAELDDPQRERLLSRLQENPPCGFRQPDLQPEGSLAQAYLQDLVRLAVCTPPYDAAADQLVLDSAAYLRQDVEAVRSSLDNQYLAYLAQRFAPHGLPKRIPPAAVRAVLSLLEAEDQPRSLYRGVLVERPEAASYPRQATWLLGTEQRLVLFTIAEQPKLLWRGDRQVRAERTGRFLRWQCRLTGGQWLAGGEPVEPVLCVPAPTAASAEKYFQPLTAFCTGARSSL